MIWQLNALLINASACAQAVNDELVRQQGQPTNGNGATTARNAAEKAANGNGHASTNGNGNGNGNGHGPSDKQFSYARQLAGQIKGLGIRRLETLAQRIYSKPLVGLTSLEASGLIDTLKAIKAGRIDLAAIAEETAA